jgi:DNA-directed RNA polymerase subunit RPC12/RpoP
MIQLTLAWFVFIYLTVFLAGILIFWIGYEMLRKRLSSTASHHSVHCRICGMKLAISSSTELVSCPSCGSLNESNHQGGL